MIRVRPVALLVLLGFFTGTCFGQSPALKASQARFSSAVLTNFSAWDTSGDGKLEEAELQKAVQDPKVTGDAAAAAAVLMSAVNSKKAPPFPDWTRDYFQADSPSLEYLVKRFRVALTRIKTASPEVMANGELLLKECKQGALGDCYLVAATGAAVARDPGIVGKMIRLDSDQVTYVVTYPDGQEVRVPALTQGELAMGGGSDRNGLWLRILEKAWGVRKISGSSKLDPGAEPIDAMGHGGSIRATLEAMTGHFARSYRLGNTKKGANVKPEQLRSELQDAIRDRRLVGAATPAVVNVPGISHNHAYAILGYDSQTDLVTIWNPHVNKFTPKGTPGLENGYATLDGIFSMPVADFIATYSSVSIETDRAKVAPR